MAARAMVCARRGQHRGDDGPSNRPSTIDLIPSAAAQRVVTSREELAQELTSMHVPSIRPFFPHP